MGRRADDAPTTTTTTRKKKRALAAAALVAAGVLAVVASNQRQQQRSARRQRRSLLSSRDEGESDRRLNSKREAKKLETARQQKMIAKSLEGMTHTTTHDSARNVVHHGSKKASLFKSDEEERVTALEPMWGLQHTYENDVIMALGFGYAQKEFARFVSTLRKTGFSGDVVLATEPERRMKTGVAAYLKRENVLCYGFEYSCVKKKQRRRLLSTPAGCTLTNWYAGGDARGPRPLAVSRYEMYRSWILKYSALSWGIVFDFRDTYFQRNPFSIVDRSPSAPNLHLFAENRRVKTVGNCVFNSGWLRCWGKQTPRNFANRSVVCSGSTMGARDALLAYVERMIAEMDAKQCHTTPARTESDQGYHNYLYDSGELAALDGVRVTHWEQGTGGLVNTIGAMNGFRVPKHMKGPLDTFWKIRDDQGFLLDYDGQRSAVVHQWDRFYKEMVHFIDRQVQEYEVSRRNTLSSP